MDESKRDSQERTQYDEMRDIWDAAAHRLDNGQVSESVAWSQLVISKALADIAETLAGLMTYGLPR